MDEQPDPLSDALEAYDRLDRKYKAATQEAQAMAVALEKKDEALEQIGSPDPHNPGWRQERAKEALAIKPSPQLLERYYRQVRAKAKQETWEDALRDIIRTRGIYHRLRGRVKMWFIRRKYFKDEAAKSTPME